MNQPTTSDETLSRACLLYLQGRTVRSLAVQFGIAKTTLHSLICKRVGKGCQRNGSGTIAIVDEYLKSPKLSGNQKSVIRRWLATNFQQMADLDAERGVPLYTNRKERMLTAQECGSRCDFRANLNRGHGDYAA